NRHRFIRPLYGRNFLAPPRILCARRIVLGPTLRFAEDVMNGPTDSRAKNWVLALTALASFMVALDAVAVSTALSTIRPDLAPSIEALEWVVNAYNLSFAVLLLTGAALGDRFGRRRMFAAGLVLFVVASAACALSRDATALIAARALQGTGAALVMPLAMA